MGDRGTWTAGLAGGVSVVSTGIPAGDLGPDDPAADARRHAVVDLPWVLLRQVHGRGVAVVGGPPAPGAVRPEADAAVAPVPGVALAVLTADCAPVALASPEGIVGVVHAGWRGLVAGVVGAAADAMRALGATRLEAALGPCIHPGCYRFGPGDLDVVAAAVGPEVRSTDRGGHPALDLPAGVRAACASAGVDLVAEAGTCTACSPGHWSWRAAADTGRQATVAWRT